MKFFLNILLPFILVFVVIIGTLFTTRVINKDFSVNKVKLIFDMPSIGDSISQHQKDARYMPYKVRLIIFNKSVYVYQIFRNISNFWNLNNINKTILLVNIYPLVVGFYFLKKRDKRKLMCVLLILANSLIIGINKMVDARAATLFILPVFAFLIIKGIPKINLKIYLPLLILNIILLI